MTRIAPPITIPSTTVVEASVESDTDPLTSTMAALELSAKERKAYVVTMPWKVRLRVLCQLLKLLVEQQKQDEEENGMGESRGKISPVKEFIGTFLPEVSMKINFYRSL